jgi:hypothetical protein
MKTDKPLQIHSRLASPDELASIPWLKLLSPAESDMAVVALRVGDAAPGD